MNVAQQVSLYLRTAPTDPRAVMARPSFVKFSSLIAQLAMLLAVFYLYDIEEQTFGILSVLIVTGFAIHYWLPFSAKEPFLIGWSIVGTFVLLSFATALLLLVVGLGLYLLIASPLPFRTRLILVGAVAAVAVFSRATLS